ncbi:hypothetical protein Tco_1350060 [Tanacetum coccineum]
MPLRKDGSMFDSFSKNSSDDESQPSSNAEKKDDEGSSGLPEKVGDEAVHKELGDRMERAATTASSLEAELDSGIINRTQSMATLNEPNP